MSRSAMTARAHGQGSGGRLLVRLPRLAWFGFGWLAIGWLAIGLDLVAGASVEKIFFFKMREQEFNSTRWQ